MAHRGHKYHEDAARWLRQRCSFENLMMRERMRVKAGVEGEGGRDRELWGSWKRPSRCPGEQ